MRAADIATASLLMLLGVVVLVEAIRLGFRWGPDGPQSGFFPFWLAVVVIAHSAAILVQAVRKRSGEPFATREQLRSVLTVAWPAAAMVLLTQFIGLYVAAVLYLASYMRLVGRHSWVTTVGLSLAIPLLTFLLFEKWFLVPLPKGPLEAWLGY
ncbi:MAG TPA: tripartite tricarboxylate transporter TctB family protein [Myxococcales bacterium]|nr:tripartite tricarboxylate transporter TctB family protein [Myxococcales bacterium]